MIETDVLVVGCGPAGLVAAMALARVGTGVLAISKHRQLAPTPRAHVTNQRSFEIFRDFGIEEEALSLSTSYDEMPNELFLRSLTGDEFGRIRGLALENATNRNASPCVLADLPQHLLEPLLFKTALRFGAEIRFSTELTSFEQTKDGVLARVEDHVSHEVLEIKAKYLLGADGGRSIVASSLQLPFAGPGRLGGSVNILFSSDLSAYVEQRPGLLYTLIRTAMDAGGAGLGILRCIKPWTDWMLIKGYSAGEETPGLSEAEAESVIRDYLGVPDLELKVTSVDLWDLNSMCATQYQRDRILCLGDAVHRHSPSNGLGSNTAMQDAYNLAWKLGMVIAGKAGAQLLDSYSQERVPVGQRIVTRATRSMESYTPILKALGVLDAKTSEQIESCFAELKFDSASGRERRQELQKRIRAKVYEFQARGIELNQLYRSTAIVDEGQEPAHTQEDLELNYRVTTCPGAHVPHARLQRDGMPLSTLDLVGHGRFCLLTGVGGNAWIRAAEAEASKRGIRLDAHRIGPGCAITDLYFEWAERREIEEDGCLLVRPDGYIAWRCLTLDRTDAGSKLADVFSAILYSTA